MRCLAVCQTELAIRMLDEILLPSFEMDFIVERKPLAKRLHDSGLNVTAGGGRTAPPPHAPPPTPPPPPGACVGRKAAARHSLKKIVEAIFNAGATLVYVLGVGA